MALLVSGVAAPAAALLVAALPPNGLARVDPASEKPDDVVGAPENARQ